MLKFSNFLDFSIKRVYNCVKDQHIADYFLIGGFYYVEKKK